MYSSDNVDWEASARAIPSDALNDCPNFVSSLRKHPRVFERHLPNVDRSQLNSDQPRAYDIIADHFAQKKLGLSVGQLKMLICGTAGTGKSFLISAIAGLLVPSCLLTGTTGVAACNICGCTLHSTLQLPVGSHKRCDLKGASLGQLQQTFVNKSYLIVDEMSLIGQNMMFWIDKRLREATGYLNLPLGGFHVILMGDFGHLPPVGDIPLYSSCPQNEQTRDAYSMYRLFDTVVFLNTIVRQSGVSERATAFRSLLLRLRSGDVTIDDWKMLLQRSPGKASNSHTFDGAIRLFYDRQTVHQYNIDKLKALKKPIARINALHSSRYAASVVADEAGGLEPVLFLAEGAPIILIRNLNPQAGLSNGTRGIVLSLLYARGHTPPTLPIASLASQSLLGYRGAFPEVRGWSRTHSLLGPGIFR